LFFLVPFSIILLYFWGAFGETGIFPLHHTQSTPLLWAAIIVFILGFVYLSGQLNVTRPSTSISKEQDGKVARAVKGPGYREEYFIRANPEKILREVLKEQWPFDEISSSSTWRAVDKNGNDITDFKLSDFEGTTEIVFEDEYGLDR
jgi:hypothetical protein